MRRALRRNLHLLAAVACGALLGSARLNPMLGVAVIAAVGYLIYRYSMKGEPLGWVVEYAGLSVASWGVAATFLSP